VLRQTRQRGIRILGYVTTDYGNRSLARVKSDIERWHAWYAVDGVFFDEVSTSAMQVDYCQKLYDHAKSEGAPDHVVALNPGRQTLAGFMPACDILVNSESTWPTYRDAFAGNPDWIANYPASRFWHVVHGCPTEADMQTALKLAHARRAGWIFVTNGTGSNPYRRLPGGSYWENQLRLASIQVQYDEK
jgi:hypothetical protein